MSINKKISLWLSAKVWEEWEEWQRKCCHFTSGNWRPPSRQVRQDMAGEAEHVFDNSWVCDQGLDLFTISAQLEIYPSLWRCRASSVLEICCRPESACLGTLDGSEAGPGLITGLPKGMAVISRCNLLSWTWRCCHLLNVWTQAVSSNRCLTWEDLGQTKPEMWAKSPHAPQSWGAKTLCLYLNLFPFPLTSVWWPFSSIPFRFLPHCELKQGCWLSGPWKQFLLRQYTAKSAQ